MTAYAEIDGIKTARPKGQDIRPKAFKNNPWPLAMIAFSEPTDRYVLWFIRHYKYGFNVFHTSDFAKWMKPPDGDKSKWPLAKYMVVVKSLMDRNLIKYGDKQRLTLVLTTKGRLYRLTTHSQWPLIQIGVPVITAILIAIIVNWNKYPKEEHKEAATNSTNLKPYDSSQSPSFQIQTLKDSGSFLIATDTTTKKDSTTY